VDGMLTQAGAEFFNFDLCTVTFLLTTFVVVIDDSGFRAFKTNHVSSCCHKKFPLPLALAYFRISTTTPAPTVWPPSRIAKRTPFSRATGVKRSTSMVTLSPGITISVPAGN